MKNREEIDEARKTREQIRNLYKHLPPMKTGIKTYEEERRAILERLPTQNWQDPMPKTGGPSDPTYQKLVELQKLEKKYLETVILVRRLESAPKILNDEEKKLFQAYFVQEKSLTAIGQELGCRQERVSKQINRIAEKIENWLNF